MQTTTVGAITLQLNNPGSAEIQTLFGLASSLTAPKLAPKGMETKAAAAVTPKGKSAKSVAPSKTVSDEDADDIEDEANEDEDLDMSSDDPADFEDDTDDVEEVAGPIWEDVMTVLKKYGPKYESQVDGIYSKLGLKSRVELKNNPKKWDSFITRVEALGKKSKK